MNANDRPAQNPGDPSKKDGTLRTSLVGRQDAPDGRRLMDPEEEYARESVGSDSWDFHA